MSRTSVRMSSVPIGTKSIVATIICQNSYRINLDQPEKARRESAPSTRLSNYPRDSIAMFERAFAEIRITPGLGAPREQTVVPALQTFLQ